MSLLTTFLDNDTLPVYLSALTSAVPRVTAGIVDVLGRSTTYDPNRLLTLLPIQRCRKPIWRNSS